MPTSKQLLSWDMIATEVANGTMMWSGSVQSGKTVPNFSQWQAKVSNDGLDPSGYLPKGIAPYSYLLAHAVVQPTSVVAVPTTTCGTCTCSSANSWASRPTGWSVLFRETLTGVFSGAFTNLGTVNSNSNIGFIAATPSTSSQIYQFQVKYTNGTTTTPVVNSNIINFSDCPSCPA